MKFVLFLFFLALSGATIAQDFKTYNQTIPGTAVTFKMAAIPAGKFKIGSAITERGRNEDEGPQKEITLSAFWMGEHEVTFAEWDLYFKDNTLP
ncbi:MAG TPA: SUMF1/EgtB/PvdO family nonheme iron enzyme, partial [Cyclobacteriaceae bacterium]|nr:SUMF1/EgtB/PvdO family nonheme iron enzyme [Cyclobacteriaceae bacterium]